LEKIFQTGLIMTFWGGVCDDYPVQRAKQQKHNSCYSLRNFPLGKAAWKKFSLSCPIF